MRRSIKFLLVALLFVVVLVYPSWGQPQARVGDGLIIPGVRMGDLKIGMGLEEAIDLMETFGPVDFFGCNPADVGFCIWVDDTGKFITEIATDDPRFHTVRGQTAGKPFNEDEFGPADVVKQSGGAEVRGWLKRGIGIVYDPKTNLILAIHIFKPEK